MPNLFHIGKKFGLRVDRPTDLKEYIGRCVRVKKDDGTYKLVEIKEVLGSLAHQTKLQIETEKDGSFVISALDFFAQMNGERVTEEEIALFDETAMEVMSGPPRVTPGGIIH